MAGVWVIVERTRFGAQVKAGAHDSEIVQALGIDLTRLRVWVFVLGTMLAAFAGVVMAPLWGIRPHMGVDAVVPAFLIIVLGGVGSFWGAAIGGILVGLVVGLSGAYASEWSMLSMYLLLIAVVTFRARGLFGKKSILEALRCDQFACYPVCHGRAYPDQPSINWLRSLWRAGSSRQARG
jgi:branched-subunit amino acid ABC-type transport system permease component